MRRVDFAWELGGHTGHVATLMPVARAMRARGHAVRFLLKELRAGADLEGMAQMERIAAPIWVGPPRFETPLNFGEILTNFGYADPASLRQLIDAWRERLAQSAAVVANVAPAAHIAARTLGLPSFEISQGFHIPPPVLPAPPLRDWEPMPRERLEAADRAVLAAINGVLDAYGAKRIASIGELFVGRSVLLTYPELDIYPQRGPAEYFGIPRSGEGSAAPPWPEGRGPRVFAYLYNYYEGLNRLLEALAARDCPTLMLCRDIDPALRGRYAGGPVYLATEPMSVSRLLPEADLIVCHGSHQMTAQALLAGKPLLLLPSQLEQFLITRRVVRFGAGLGVAPREPNADFSTALAELTGNPRYTEKARDFAQRYARHDRDAALGTMVARCEAALERSAVRPLQAGADVPTLLRALESTQWLDAKTIRDRQLATLAPLLHHAFASTPGYQKHWRGRYDPAAPLTSERFAELPLLSRTMLQAEGAAMRSTALPADHLPVEETRTSGSTGAPVRVLKTALTALWWRALTLRDHAWHRRDFSRTLAVIRRGVTPGEASSWGAATDGVVRTGKCVMLDVDIPVRAQLEWLARQKAGYLLTYPSLAAALAREALARGVKLPGLLEVRTLGELLDPEARALCREAWNVPLTDVYSAEEVGYVALQCPLHEHYHVQSESVLVEVLDEAGAACQPGQVGRVVVTDLHNYALPLVRYDIGDYAEAAAACDCGRGLPVLKRILGRTRGTLVTANGERYWPAFGSRAIADITAIRQHQFVQKSYDLVEARLVVAAPLAPAEEERLRKHVLSRMPPGFRLQIAYRDSIPRSAGGKFEEFVSEIT